MRYSALLGSIVLTLTAAGCECGDPSDGDGGLFDDGGVLPDGFVFPDAGPVGTGELAEGPVCTPGGWCWETPQPAGGNLSGIWSPEPGRLIAGSGTHMFHVEDDVIRHAAPPTLTPYLNGIPVWGASPDDVWANAFGSLIHFDGGRWTETGSVGFASSISGVAGDDVWAVGFSNLSHYDGASWTTLDTSGLTEVSFADVWAIGPDEAIVVGSEMREARVWHVTGTTIEDLAIPVAMGNAFGVYASGLDDIWVGVSGGLWRYDGSWSQISTSSIFAQTTSFIWGSGPGDVWITNRDSVLHWDGAGMETIPVDGARQLTAVAGTSPTDVWATDLDGQIHHWDGSAWTTRFKAMVTPADFTATSVQDDGVGWAIGPQGIAERAPDGTWSGVASPTMSPLVGVAHTGAETFLFAMGGAYRRNGGAWELVLGGSGLTDACATSDGTTWAVGDRLATYSAGEWVDASVVAPGAFGRIQCQGDEAWATPAAGTDPEDGLPILHWDGAQWGLVGLTSIAHLEIGGAVAPAADDAWVVAQTATSEGIVMRWDGAQWRQVSGLPSTVRGVGASGATDVWVVGDSGLARRWDGSSWSNLDAAGGPAFGWVGPAGDGTALAITEAGVVWRYDGSAWSAISGTLSDAGIFAEPLVDVAFRGGEVFAAGDRRALRFDGAAWSQIDSFSAVRVAASETGGVWFVDQIDYIGRWDETSGMIVQPDTSFRSASDVILPFTGSEVFAVNERNVFRFDGSTFQVDHSVDNRGLTLFGYAADAMWLLSAPGFSRDDFAQVWRRTPTWELAPELGAPIGFGTDDMDRLLAMDADLGIWRREGGGWRLVIDPREGFEGRGRAGYLYSLTDAWVLALNGLLHFDGAAWSQLADPVGLVFNDLEASPDGTLYAAGRGAAVVSRQPD